MQRGGLILLDARELDVVGRSAAGLGSGALFSGRNSMVNYIETSCFQFPWWVYLIWIGCAFAGALLFSCVLQPAYKWYKTSRAQ